MAPISNTQKKRSHDESLHRPKKRKRDLEDLDSLQQRVQNLDPKEDNLKLFADLPLSQTTASGLDASHFKTLTDIQRSGIPLALKGSDILGAAKTGSGKTLAFLVPVLENLYRRKWTELDGLGALILSPTRELAIQIFDVLRKIGRNHVFSAGLVIGGKSLQEERDRLHRMNILVCTPGRILQHMDQTAVLDVSNLQMLVLDEADRIMDMGFQSTVDAIVEHLPKQRQTLLYSATQTKKVSDLARLSLKDPEYVAVHEAANSATPSTLQQNYIVTPLPDKLDTLWGFIKANLKSKILVFLSSGKQVRFAYEAFRHLRPGIPILHLHGRQKQTARLDITDRFSSSKTSCLFATDVVARGLDFPAVDWVIQLDCPEDADTYIHRVGRTARYERNGRAVLFLEPSEEEGMLKRLKQKKVLVERIDVRENKQQTIKNQLQNMCFKDPELKYLGQKAFISYVRSIYIQKDKEVFKLNELPLEEFSASLGLPGTPKIKFVEGDNAKTLKNASRYAMSSPEGEGETQSEGERSKGPKNATRTKYDRMFERQNQDVLSHHYTKLLANDTEKRNGDADEDGDFLKVKSRLEDHLGQADDSDTNEEFQPSGTVRVVPGLGQEPLVIDSKRKEKLLKSKKKLLKLKDKGTKLVFDEQGQARQIYELEDENQFKQRGTANMQKAKFLDAEHKKLQAADIMDKQTAKGKRKEKKEKRKAREAADTEDGERVQAFLVPYEELDGGEEVQIEAADKGAVKPLLKRPPKWFEDDFNDDRKSKRRARAESSRVEPETLEDLETAVANLFK